MQFRGFTVAQYGHVIEPALMFATARASFRAPMTAFMKTTGSARMESATVVTAARMFFSVSLAIGLTFFRRNTELPEKLVKRSDRPLMRLVLRWRDLFPAEDARLPRRDRRGSLLRREHRAAADLAVVDRRQILIGAA